MITTAPTARDIAFHKNRFLKALLFLYGAAWLLLALAPSYRFDWFLENILVFIWVAIGAATYRRFVFSDLSYLLMALFLFLHALGAHYTYSEVPLGSFLSSLFGAERNHYDRVIHFLYGLLMLYPFRELVLRRSNIRGGWAGFVCFCLVLAFSVSYEIIEWVAALIVSPEAAFAFLGTQGDVFDAQKDSTLAGIGALIAIFLVSRFEKKKSRSRVPHRRAKK